MLHRIIVSALLGVALCAASGCGSTRAETPQDAAEKLRAAIESRREGAFMGCFVDSQDHLEALRGLLASIDSTVEYEQVLRKHEGKDALGPAASAGIVRLAGDWLEGARFTTEGDQSLCVLQDGTELKLVRDEKEGWVFESRGVLEAMSRQLVARQVGALGVEPPVAQ